jgi:hypothetical protein
MTNASRIQAESFKPEIMFLQVFTIQQAQRIYFNTKVYPKNIKYANRIVKNAGSIFI